MIFHVNCLPVQTIHIKCQVLFSLKSNEEKLECPLLQFYLALYGLSIAIPVPLTTHNDMGLSGSGRMSAIFTL